MKDMKDPTMKGIKDMKGGLANACSQ